MKDQSFGAKIVVFVLGIAVIAAGAFLLISDREYDIAKFIISCIVVMIVYILAFLPILIEGFFRSNVSAMVIGGVVYYRGMIPYACASIAIIVRMYMGLPIRFAILAQCISLAVFLLYFFLSFFTQAHIENVAAAEETKKAGVMLLREEGNQLALAADRLGEKDKDLKESIKKLAGDFRFLSPSDNERAIELEDRMIRLLEELNADRIFANSENRDLTSVREKVGELDYLYKQRKSIL